MQLSSALLVVAAAISGVAAHPSPAAAHRHARLHGRNIEARGDKWVMNVKPSTTSVQSTPEPTTAAASTPAASTPSSSPSTGSGSGVKKAFCSGTNAKRATAYDIAYKGNIGGTGDSWGCNIMEVDCDTVDLYDYTAKFTGAGRDTTYACSAFNKIGPNGVDINGFWYSALDFSVKSGESRCLAFDTNSQGGVACGVNSVPKTNLGQLAGTWCEFDAGSSKNDNQSGSDVSIIVAENFGMTDYISMNINAPGKGDCSTLVKSNPSRNKDIYRKGDEDLDGVGCTGYSTGTLFVTLGE
ncbi:hypothetical protein jhhlp_000817 [Lomentospora prolificans]|uniref:Allergen Asp f 4 n=1 Tax=Lomentospora prolificans TaxID=41688 RepID=A0A2N3NJI6_9PEZI|nr:hypothetical protein jhhlp_000817 [Lomentospora prolificans]